MRTFSEVYPYFVRVSFTIRFTESPIGFVRNAELINSRAAMVGFFVLLIVEAIINEPFLKFIGIEVGKGINIGF